MPFRYPPLDYMPWKDPEIPQNGTKVENLYLILENMEKLVQSPRIILLSA